MMVTMMRVMDVQIYAKKNMDIIVMKFMIMIMNIVNQYVET